MKKYKKFIFLVIFIIIILISIFIFFKLSNENKFWTITQFGNNDGGQMMCFTIEGNKNGLVIIDGGYRNGDREFEFLKNKIEEHGNKVDAWILTHLDSDHAGAFIRVYNEFENLDVKQVLVSDFPSDINVLQENAPWETEWEDLQDFMALDLPQKTFVHSNDEFENIIGLKMKVFSAYDNWIDEQMNDLINNGSIVCKLYGKEENFLITGDAANSKIGDYLIENYKEDLKSDYLQVTHHGNNHLSEEFYKVVSPQKAFFCAPDWLFYNEQKNPSWTIERNRKILENLGTNLYWHNTSPNIIELH